MAIGRTPRTLVHLLVLSLAAAPGQLRAQAATPAGSWSGTWDSPNGSFYSAVAQFTVTEDGSLDGTITWTLRGTRRIDLKPKVGQSGIEYVHGTFDARCRVAAFAGYKLDDPQQILGMDHYQLILAPNGQGFGGVTGNDQGQGDTWTGMISFRR